MTNASVQQFYSVFSSKFRQGQSVMEYAFVLALVSVTAVAVLQALGN